MRTLLNYSYLMPLTHRPNLLRSSSFNCFLTSQFLGAFNDNIYKIIISMFAVDAARGTNSWSFYLSLIGGLFILPFFLFSGHAGFLADLFSKRKILISVKAFEVAIMG